MRIQNDILEAVIHEKGDPIISNFNLSTKPVVLHIVKESSKSMVDGGDISLKLLVTKKILFSGNGNCCLLNCWMNTKLGEESKFN